MEDIVSLKKQLRKFVKDRLKNMTEHDREQKSNSVCAKLFELYAVQKAKAICLYSAMPLELNLNGLISKLIAENKVVFLPRINGDELELINFDFSSQTTAENAYKISEPLGKPLEDLSKIDVIIIPLVAFDSENHRLGHGKGFYDRLLKKLPNALKIGVAFCEQQLESVPTDSNDVLLDKIIFE